MLKLYYSLNTIKRYNTVPAYMGIVRIDISNERERV